MKGDPLPFGGNFSIIKDNVCTIYASLSQDDSESVFLLSKFMKPFVLCHKFQIVIKCEHNKIIMANEGYLLV